MMCSQHKEQRPQASAKKALTKHFLNEGFWLLFLNPKGKPLILLLPKYLLTIKKFPAMPKLLVGGQ